NRKQAVNKASKTAGFLEHAADDVHIIGDWPLLLKSDLAHASNRGQRSTQLVRRIRRNPSKFFKRRFQPRQSVIEDARQMAGLVIRIVDWQAIVEPVRGDLLGSPRH